MSVSPTKVVCTACDFEAYLQSRRVHLVYRLEDGSELSGGYRQGWCGDCQTFVDIEDLAPAELADELGWKRREQRDAGKHVEQLSGDWLGRLRHRALLRALRATLAAGAQRIATLEARLALATRRRAGPRCLRCWSERTTPVSFDPRDGITPDVRHHCGGTLRRTEEYGACSISFRPSTLVLDPEGRLVEKR